MGSLRLTARHEGLKAITTVSSKNKEVWQNNAETNYYTKATQQDNNRSQNLTAVTEVEPNDTVWPEASAAPIADTTVSALRSPDTVLSATANDTATLPAAMDRT